MKKNSLYLMLFSFFAIYTIIGFVAVPKLAKPQIEKLLNKNLTQKASLEKIEFNPFILKFTAHKLKIFDENEITISINKLIIDFSIFKSLEERHLSFKNIEVINPYINIIEYEDGTLNLQKLIKKQKKKLEEKKTDSKLNIKFQIHKTILDNAKIEFTKQIPNEEPFKLYIDKLNYTFYDMGTYRNTLASHNLRILINKNSELVIKGGLRLNPFKMYGNVELKNFRPNQFLTYKKKMLNFDLSDETYLDLKFGYQIDITKKLKLLVENTYLNLHNLDLKQNEKSILSLKNFSIENLNLSYPQNLLTIDSIFFNKLNSKTIINKKGVLNFTNLVKNKEEKSSQTIKKESLQNKKTWKITLKKLDIKNSNSNFKDLKNELFVNTKNINIDISNFNIKENDFTFNSLLLSKSTISFKDKKNKLQVLTKNTNAKISNLEKIKDNTSIKNILVKNPSIFLRDYKNSLKILTNSLSFEVKSLNLNNKDLKLKQAKIKTSSVKFNNLDTKMDITSKNINLIATDTSLIKNILEIVNLNLNQENMLIKNKKSKTNIVAKNISVNINKILNKKNKLKITSANVNKPYVSISIDKQVPKVKEEKKSKKIVEKKVKDKNDFQFDIGPVKIKNMQMAFEDKNLPIPFKTDITELNGNFTRFHSSSSKPTKLELEGKVDNYGYTKITGIVDINDIKLLTNTNLLFKNIAIKNFTPYSGKFVGREIESGKLNLDLKYNIKKSDLKASNSVIISDIKLGKTIESLDAVNLPLELAIALLEDSNGVIDINLPVTGNVDDPKFAIAPIVWKVFFNLITKAITSPFALLGAMLGIDEEQIKSIEFEFGKSDILASEKEVLDNIAKILSKKPKLAIKIKPAYNPIKDKIALQNIKFEQFLIKEMKKIPEGDEYKKALENIYKKANAKKGLKEIIKSFTKKDKKGKVTFDNERYVQYLKKHLVSKQKVTQKELKEIANLRIKKIMNYLLIDKKVPKSAVIIEEIVKQDKKDTKWAIFDLDVSTK